MSGPATNNAFGRDSPSWNLPFPNGNLTAAEIFAYLPHWLKSVDVIDRVVTNGGKSRAIAAIINEFRDMPTGADFHANSAQIMMSYAMRRAGYENWTVGKHAEWSRPVDREENDLNVKDFRPPRLTHPKRALQRDRQSYETVRNSEAEPVAFKDLASHVKRHPSGPDALDLSRAVQYCVEHPDEIWMFPTDFERLVSHLGGPAYVTHLHHDRQVFSRREETFSHSSRLTHNISTATRAPNNSAPPRGPASIRTSRKRKNNTEASVRMAATANTQRRSSRLVGKTNNFREDSDAEGTDQDYHETSCKVGFTTLAKRRKLSHAPRTLASVPDDSDFAEDGSEPDEEFPEEESSDEGVVSPAHRPLHREAAHKARRGIKSSFVGTKPRSSALTKNPVPMTKSEAQPAPVNPKVMELAKAFSYRRPVWLSPPQLSADRLKVDELSVNLYAAEGCTTKDEMWNSALSCYRFRGPRRHSPFRELYRLTDPDPRDTSDWAENIRWAKEQYKVFESKTWTEYDYHLETITEHRRESMWVSEATITAGM